MVLHEDLEGHRLFPKYYPSICL